MGTLLVLAFTILIGGCAAANQHEQRPFFLHEHDLQSHGRKTLLDRLVELDPGAFRVDVTPNYLQNPPLRIALLPFSDDGSANFVVNKIPLTFRSRNERYDWAWTHAQRLRHAMQGYLAEREFLVANLYGVDAVIQDQGISNMAELQQVSVEDLGDWLDVDAVMYGRVVHYDAYYFALVAAWQVGIEVRLVSTHDGKTLIRASGSRWAVSFLPAMDPQDIAINAAQNLLQLRDINLARAEEEACREVVKRIPQSDALIKATVQHARDHAYRAAARRPLLQPFSLRSPTEFGHTYPVLVDPAVDVPAD